MVGASWCGTKRKYEVGLVLSKKVGDYVELEEELAQIRQEESQKLFDENYQVIEVVVNEDADLQKLQEEYLEQEILYFMISKTLELNPHISNYYVPQGTVVSLISER